MSRKEELRFSPLPPHFDRQPWDSFLFIVGNTIFPTTYSGPPLARAVSKHPTWKPPGCHEASGLYSALALPDLSSLSQLFGGVSAWNSPPLYTRMTYLGPVLSPSLYAIKKWQCDAEIPTVSRTEPAAVLAVWWADLLQWLGLSEDAAWLRLECLCSWSVQHRACSNWNEEFGCFCKINKPIKMGGCSLP